MLKKESKEFMKEEKQLDIRHISIIDALPVFETKREILSVGCGTGFLESKLQDCGYDVIATDYFDKESREDTTYLDKIEYQKSSIFDLSTFSVEGRETVICSEVLEHLPNYKEAFKNLLQLTHRRLIITIPWNISFDVNGPPPAGHCNYWTDRGENPFSNDLVLSQKDPKFKDIREFISLAWPYNVTISKVGTKGADWCTSSRCYMIIVDKMQMSDFVPNSEVLKNFWNMNVDSETGRCEQTFSPINMPTNGIPPLRCGPFLNSEIQSKCLLICSEDTFSGNTDWLWQLENAVSKKTGLKLIVVSSQGSSDQLQNYVNYANSVGGIAAALIMTSSSDQISALSGFNCRSIVIGGDFSTAGYDVAIQREEMTEQFAQKIANAI